MNSRSTPLETSTDWWREAVIYQVYPRSLCDSDGDGVGDLAGIADKLDYLAGLGVDALWISPFFQSPMDDFGYDVSDYRAVDPLFGSMDDFDRLLEGAHDRGLRIIIDQVLSHSSSRHRWFEQSRSSRDNPLADWYVWADPQEDGTPPNNWLSIFGGPAWTWEPRRQQYYLHNFLSSQPDLNYHNPAVQAQMLDEVEFWLRRGVDGLRLDAINFCFHDPQLRDNPPKPAAERQGRGFSLDNPYAFQRHLYNNTRPENLGFLERLRDLVDRYPGVVTLGEVSSEDSLATMAEYTDRGRLHMAYSFELLVDECTGEHIRNTVEAMEAGIGSGWPCWSIGNHDVRRVLSRWGGSDPSPQQAAMLNALLLSLRGSVCCYQGEELGLTEASISRDQVQDPYGLAFWPNFKGRDGCRTPMPWGDGPNGAGFTSGEPWLPIPPEHKQLAVSRQEADPSSVLNRFRALLAWRKGQDLLRRGDIVFLDSDEDLLLFERRLEDRSLLCAFNLGDRTRTVSTPGPLVDVTPPGGMPANVSHGRIELPPHGYLFASRA